MSEELTQWLVEIRTLKQKLAEAQTERDAANESAANWRRLYTKEAEQRRTEAKLAQEQIETLKAQIAEQSSSVQNSDRPTTVEPITQKVGQPGNVQELQAKLQQIIIERDRLLQALKSEQANHAQTRRSLTSVIADTIDKMTKEKGKI
ncbi:hypothetical protein Cri9333_4357 [Crinalium epipsammum PCC 9333]|uniref:Uncharacterized protein n=1 Tax=Crinalium epipsammum PCC 9333 TaxID=1173022 RepID=K9W463_9CYAN|nr:hypothetical protein [Crinalium epipsammum]AFZ15143.1 hypothetical protein Cri9333_4357 [Crinalium epipsammum PCC 9333]